MKKFTLRKSKYKPETLRDLDPDARLLYYLQHKSHILDTDLMPILGILPKDWTGQNDEHNIENCIKSLEKADYKIRTGTRLVRNRFEEPVYVKFYTLDGDTSC